MWLVCFYTYICVYKSTLITSRSFIVFTTYFANIVSTSLTRDIPEHASAPTPHSTVPQCTGGCIGSPSTLIVSDYKWREVQLPAVVSAAPGACCAPLILLPASSVLAIRRGLWLMFHVFVHSSTVLIFMNSRTNSIAYKQDWWVLVGALE